MPKGNRGGQGREGGDSMNPGDILETRDLVSQRERKAKEVDQALKAFHDVFAEYGTIVEEIQTAKLKPGSNAIAYFDGSNIAINERYFDTDKMEAAYESTVQSGYHPSKGNKTAMQAVVAHELGHKLTEMAGNKIYGEGKGWQNLDATATQIVNEARKDSGHRGVVQMASKISRYATVSNAEAIAEAFSDVYSNGRGARRESHAIVDVLNKYLKGNRQ